MEHNIQLDLATLALKGKRYSEAEAIYTQIAVQEKSPEAWVGIGICKLYQLANGRTMEEVIYCFEKAKQLNNSLKSDIEQQLILNCKIVLGAYLNIFTQSIERYKQEKKNVQTGALLTGISVIAGMNTKSAFGFVASLAGSSAGVGVAIDAFANMKNIDEIKTFIIAKCDEVNNAVRLNTNNQSEEYKEYILFVNDIINTIKQNLEASYESKKDEKFTAYATFTIITAAVGLILSFSGYIIGLPFLIGAAILFYKAYGIKNNQ